MHSNINQIRETIRGRYLLTPLDKKIIGQSPAAIQLKKMIALIAPSDAPAIIFGATGTGKELVAEALHEESRRKGRFVTINCAAIPKELMEAEIFGFEKGAFTGAVKSSTGKFEQAQKGTLFLDEIGDMPADLQTKLLRVLENSVISKVGSNSEIKLDVRIVCATHKNLNELVASNKFREDLLFRLNVFPIAVPPLRDRGTDILLLANSFLVRHARKHGIDEISFSKNCENAIESHSWPGNVRELENAVERAVILADRGKQIEGELLGLMPSTPGTSKKSGASEIAGSTEIESIEEVEKKHIQNALEAYDGNRTHAAEKLGLNVRTLRNKIKQY